MAQNINLEAFCYFFWVRFFQKSLAIPHFWVPNINYINPELLAQLGFKGVIFDKDNTLTATFDEKIYPEIAESFKKFKSVFKDNLVIMSNHAGTNDDKNYECADRVERSLGIKVLKHKRKKPAGIEAVEAYFKCDPKYLVMVGDRLFTDVVFGNRHGMLTIFTDPLTEKGDLLSAIKARGFEQQLLKKWLKNKRSYLDHFLYNKDICLGA